MEKEEQGKNHLVLIVEDDQFINTAYSSKFKHEGITAEIATDGEAALARLCDAGKKLPSLILLDIMLPKKNGFEVLETVKGDPRMKKIPVLILSNLSQDADRVRGMELGASEYIVKSEQKIESLVTKVKRYLSEEKSSGELA